MFWFCLYPVKAASMALKSASYVVFTYKLPICSHLIAWASFTNKVKGETGRRVRNTNSEKYQNWRLSGVDFFYHAVYLFTVCVFVWKLYFFEAFTGGLGHAFSLGSKCSASGCQSIYL